MTEVPFEKMKVAQLRTAEGGACDARLDAHRAQDGATAALAVARDAGVHAEIERCARTMEE